MGGIAVTRCNAHLSRCYCGLDEHPADVPHECETPDPTCGGSWLDHPTMPSHVLVVHYPGLRPGGLNEKSGLAHDPPPGETVLEPRPDYWGPRGGIRFYPPPSLEGLNP